MKKIISILIIALLLPFLASNAFAHEVSDVELSCSGIHWEMQNTHPKFRQKFVGSVTYPIEQMTVDVLEPDEWGVLDADFPEFNGPMKVSASIYIAGDVRRIEQVINCGEMPKEVESTPEAKVKVASSSKQVQTKETVLEATTTPKVLPETGFGWGFFSLVPIVASGLFLRKYRGFFK